MPDTDKAAPKQFDAWLNPLTGTIIPRNKQNLRLRSKFTAITAEIDPETGEARDVNSDLHIAAVAASGSVKRIIASLQTLATQREQLIAAALVDKDGSEALQLMGLYDPESDTDKDIVPNAGDEVLTKGLGKGQSVTGDAPAEMIAQSAARGKAAAQKGKQTTVNQQDITF